MDKQNKKTVECIDARSLWAQENGYMDVILPSCVAIIGSIPLVQEELEPTEYLMAYITYTSIGPALVTVDYDVDTFVQDCTNSGCTARYNTPIYIKKFVDTDGLQAGNIETPAIH